MAAFSTAAKRSPELPPKPTPSEPQGAPMAYGGPVGLMLEELDLRMGSQPALCRVNEAPQDFAHSISIAAGYAGLLSGFAGILAILFRAVH